VRDGYEKAELAKSPGLPDVLKVPYMLSLRARKTSSLLSCRIMPFGAEQS